MEQQLPLKEHFGENILQILKDQVKRSCKDASNSDVEKYLYHAAALKLNPLKRQIYALPFKNPSGHTDLIPMVSIDGLRAIAHREGHCTGIKTKVFYDGKNIISAKACVEKNNGKFFSEVLMKEYYQKGKNGKPSLWDLKPHTMISKVAEAHALRKAFPEDLSGVYISEEFDKSTHDNNEYVDIPKETPAPKQLPKASKPIKEKIEPSVPDYSDEEIQKLLDRKELVLKRAKEYKITINQTAVDSIECLIECGNFRKLGEKLIAYEQHLDTHVGQTKKADEPIEKLDLNNLYEILRNAELNESYVNTWFGEEIKTYTVAKQAGDHKLANELVALMMERAYGHIAKEKERRP